MSGVQVEKVEVSGVPAFAGATAGGVMGLPFAPQIAFAGAVLGALVGGGKEYQDIKTRHQHRRRRAAWTAFRQKTGFSREAATVERVEDVSAGDRSFWQFKLRDGLGADHFVRIDKETGEVEYRPGEEGPRGV